MWSAAMMYADNCSFPVRSALVTGTMWDTIMKWFLYESDTNSDGSVESDSSSWGNYSSAEISNITRYSKDGGQNWIDAISATKGTSYYNGYWLLPTGHNDYTKRKNIYDLAGNLDEWNGEYFYEYSTALYITRGSSYNNPGWMYPPSMRTKTGKNASSLVGFRVALFVE